MFSVLCHLCNIQFEHILELEVHQLSLSHHIKLETTAPGSHTCLPCKVTCLTLGEYSKHVDTLEHRKKRDRMRAIIDTIGLCEGQTRCGTMTSVEGGHAGVIPNYREHLTPSVQDGNDRRTNTTPNRDHRYGVAYTQRGQNTSAPLSIFWQRKPDTERRFREQQATFPSRNEISLGTQESRHFHIGEKSTERRFDEHNDGTVSCDSIDESWNPAQTSVQEDISVEHSSSHLKRRSLSKKSSKRKSEGSTSKSTFDEEKGSSGKRDRKTKKRKSSSQTSSSSTRCDPGCKGDTVEIIKRIRRVPLGVPMKDKTKKWELVAVKGKASYLRNRSQRMLKDRMNKYRLVDSKGVVVEGVNEYEPCTSFKMSRSLSSNAKETSLSHHHSRIFGTAQEALSKGHRKQYEEKVSVSSTPSEIAPSTSVPSGPRCCYLYPGEGPSDLTSCSSKVYSAPRDSFPTSLLKDRDSAVLAYGSSSLSTTNVEDSQPNKTTGDSSSTTDRIDLQRAFQCSSNSVSANSSTAIESHSLTSCVDLTSLPNVSNPSEALSVKEEPTESPPPDVLPSPPRIDQTVSFLTTASGSKIGGEKERQEFWLLGIAELKKGHEIHTARLKIENLQKALIESISNLRKMEIEMNEILRRKSELLGLPAPNSFP